MVRRSRRQKLQKLTRLCRQEEGLRVKRGCPSCSLEAGDEKERRDPISVQLFPPELVEHIVSFLPVKDVVALGQTCHYFHEVCDAEGVWRRICRRLTPRIRDHRAGARPWKRAAILNYTKGLYFQAFGGRRRCLSKSVAPMLAHGYRRFLPTKDHVFILDYVGTLFFLKNALVSSTLGQIQWKRACRYVVLCRGAKDFASDPRCDTVYRKYLYVLATREQPPVVGTTDSRACDCVEVYLQSSGQRVFKMTFHHSMSFKQIVLVGQETQRALLLLTDEGKIYSLIVNETQLDQPRSYTVQLALRKVSRCLPHLRVTCMASNQSSTLYITDQGGVYFEVHTPGVYRDLFGTLQAFDPLDHQMPLALALPAKVLFCALGYNHLGLVDEFGRIFMQGNNRYGQLGTGDKMDRGEPTQVRYLQRPIALWCGLNHSLVLSQTSDFNKELLGCGCGAGGRLPGWPKGSASFVKLHIKVPLCACSLCSTRECLYMLSSHDIEQCPVYRDLPAGRVGGSPEPTQGAGAPQDPGGTAQACEEYLSQIHSCPTLQDRMAKMKEIVGWMPLMAAQRDFFWEALDMLQKTPSGSGPGTSTPES
ncbi:F-box only protein 24 [Cricetulus griseus]|uniref:F-box only protein 24 n=1 Tax=Cricetulus griseus TaxID=10029 RepID=G3I663_CRIGR|nr:F-box only protein 24 [Cricetulus griseus]XP_027298096.1 F-box only protein 24 [Cricetulus griseus]EGW06319.1 F-box only protein 24 [Cricetulus griseus]ERE76146.1 F-box only protein 24 [Cricetulus griseus]